MGSNNNTITEALSAFSSDIVPKAAGPGSAMLGAAKFLVDNNVHQELWEKAKFSQQAVIQHAIATADITVDHTVDELLGKFDLPIHSRLIMLRAKDMSMADTVFPFIILPVNPQSLKVSYKKRSDIVYTIGGFVLQHWHDDIITITAGGTFPTLRNKAKVLTNSFRAFMSLLNFYRSIGNVKFFPETFESSPSLATKQIEALRGPSAITKSSGSSVANGQATQATGSITDSNKKSSGTQLKVTMRKIQNSIAELRYQADVYRGIFTEFNVDEDYEHPNSLNYSFTFKAFEKSDTFWGSLDENSSASSYFPDRKNILNSFGGG